jgi:hypothetical protein
MPCSAIGRDNRLDLNDDIFARERRLRRLAAKRGYILVRPWAGDRRGIGGLQTCYVLVPRNSGSTWMRSRQS